MPDDFKIRHSGHSEAESRNSWTRADFAQIGAVIARRFARRSNLDRRGLRGPQIASPTTSPCRASYENRLSIGLFRERAVGDENRFLYPMHSPTCHNRASNDLEQGAIEPVILGARQEGWANSARVEYTA